MLPRTWHQPGCRGARVKGSSVFSGQAPALAAHGCGAHGAAHPRVTARKSHPSRWLRDRDRPETCARLIPLLSALPGHPTRAPTGCQPPPLGRQGQPGPATGRAPGRQHPLPGPASPPGPHPAHRLHAERWEGAACPQPCPLAGRARAGTAAPPQPARLPAAWPAHRAPGSAGTRPVRGRWQRRAARRALCAGAGMPGWPQSLGDILARGHGAQWAGVQGRGPGATAGPCTGAGAGLPGVSSMTPAPRSSRAGTPRCPRLLPEPRAESPRSRSSQPQPGRSEPAPRSPPAVPRHPLPPFAAVPLPRAAVTGCPRAAGRSIRAGPTTGPRSLTAAA